MPQIHVALRRNAQHSGEPRHPSRPQWPQPCGANASEQLWLRPQPAMYYYGQVHSRRAKMVRLRTRTGR